MLKNKTSIITGSNRGIGKKIVEIYAKNGSDIFACARSENSDFLHFISETEEKFNVKIHPIYFDLSDHTQINEGVQRIKSIEPNIDILVNNAGVPSGALFQMTSIKELEKTMRINYFSQIILTQGIVRLMMRNKNGAIVNISSVSGIDGDPGTLSYGSSKASLIFATKTISNEVGKYNIRVNTIAPGPIITDMLEQMDEKAKEAMISRTALGKIGSAEDVANLSMFLSSDLSKHITGQTIRIDGGMS